jgi:signal transduction histidine kinase
MLLLFQTQLRRSVDSSLRQAATARADLLDRGADPVSLTGGGESMIWIGNENGTVIATGGSYVPQDNPIPEVHNEAVTHDLIVIETYPSGRIERERQEMRLLSVPSSDGRVVVVGAEEESTEESVGRLARLLAVAVPATVLVVLVLTWSLTGRALTPVERIRQEAAEIGGQDLDRRVPVPDADDEIRELAMTMNDMLARLQAHDAGLRQFTADASHELKSPVANLRVLIDTHELGDSQWSSLQRKLGNETDRLRALIDNLLFLAAHNEGRRPTSRTAVPLDDLLFAEAELVAATTDLDVDVSQVGPAMVEGSRSDLARMFRNLVDNAVRHAVGKVTFVCQQNQPAKSVLVHIIDDGGGITPEDRERIFERFTRLDEARARDQGGTGLGLAIVSAVAADHQAELAVSYLDEIGADGTRFTVTFPAPT